MAEKPEKPEKMVTREVKTGTVRDADGEHGPGEPCKILESEAKLLEEQGIVGPVQQNKPDAGAEGETRPAPARESKPNF